MNTNFSNLPTFNDKEADLRYIKLMIEKLNKTVNKHLFQYLDNHENPVIIGEVSHEYFKGFNIIYFEACSKHFARGSKAFFCLVYDGDFYQLLYNNTNVCDLTYSGYNIETTKTAFKNFLNHLLNQLN